MPETFDRTAYLEGQNRVYRELFTRHGRTEEALCCTKNKQHDRYAALVRHFPDGDFKLLDYGCGLGDLKPWLAVHRPSWRYLGVDILSDFIESNRSAYGSDDFRHIKGPADLAAEFDLCVLSGVFNIRHVPLDDHWAIARETLSQLFARAGVALAVDFLASDVDYMQESSYHQNPGSLAEFVSRSLSRRWVMDKSYLPYEYCITIFKDIEISRPRNVYENRLARP